MAKAAKAAFFHTESWDAVPAGGAWTEWRDSGELGARFMALLQIPVWRRGRNRMMLETWEPTGPTLADWFDTDSRGLKR
jgi:hypothetical protein